MSNPSFNRTKKEISSKKRELNPKLNRINLPINKSRKIIRLKIQNRKKDPLQVAISVCNYEIIYELINMGYYIPTDYKIDEFPFIWWLMDKLTVSSFLLSSRDTRFVLDTIKILINDTKNYKIKNLTGETILMLACSLGLPDIVRKIIQNIRENSFEYDWDINSVDSTGKNALMYVDLNHTEGNSLEIIKILLKSGANPEIQDFNGESVLSKAIREKHNTIAKMLLGIKK